MRGCHSLFLWSRSRLVEFPLSLQKMCCLCKKKKSTQMVPGRSNTPSLVDKSGCPVSTCDMPETFSNELESDKKNSKNPVENKSRTESGHDDKRDVAESKSVCSEKEVEAAKSLSEIIAQFALDLMAELGSSNSDVFFSPFSLSVALAMCYEGAEFNTAKQMKEAFFKGALDDHKLREGFKGIVSLLSRTCSAFELNTANRLYIRKGGQIWDSFIETLAAHYHSTIKGVDFYDEERARKEINDWVEEQTKSKIKDLIPKDVLNAGTLLVIVNAIYFKGDWQEKFLEDLTIKKPFWNAQDQHTEVEMMRHFNADYDSDPKHFGYLERKGLQVLKIPYEKHLAMYILLPRKIGGLKILERQLTGSNLLTLISKTRDGAYVFAAIPKLKMETTYPALGGNLKNMGAEHMFNKMAAEFGKIGKIRENGEKFRDIWVFKVVHKAFLEMNEKGTEAAAATAVIMACEKYCSLDISSRIQDKPAPKIFIADRPFLFLILDTRTNTTLFIGTFFAGKEEESGGVGREECEEGSVCVEEEGVYQETEEDKKKAQEYFGDIPESFHAFGF